MLIAREQFYSVVGLWLPLVMRLASLPTANLSYFMVALYATLGRAQAIQALAMSWLFTMINPAIAPDPSFTGIGKYCIYFGALGSVVFRSGIGDGDIRLNKVILFPTAFGILLIVHSVLFSSMPDVSILKAISWALVTIILFSAWSGLSAWRRSLLFGQLYHGLVGVMLLSLPLLLLPVGYLRNSSGFQGILNHPQVFGPVMAMLGVIAGSKLFSEKKPSLYSVVIFGLATVLILSSESRTAGLAMVLGLLSGIVSVFILSKKRIGSVLPGIKGRRGWSMAGCAVVLFLVFAPYISDKFDHYISKSGRASSAENVAEAYDGSRGALIYSMLMNISEYPLTGIGFGIASNLNEMRIQRDPLFGLPIGAPVEKGVLPIAIIEELGIPLALTFAIWILYLVRRAAVYNGVVAVSLLFTVFFINLGENILFSPGGLGMLVLLGMTWASSTVVMKQERS